MKTLELDATVDGQGRLVLDAPIPLPTGRVRVTVDVADDDAAEDDAEFKALAAHVWADSLADAAEDVYTLADGVPIDPATGETVREAR